LSKKKSRYPKRLRTTYYNMNQRCYNPDAKGYKYYGGKGVIICEEWLENKNNFFDWAVNNGYTDELSIDRIETEGNYEPENCRWITMTEQQSNRTNNVFLEIDGEIKTFAQWTKDTGIGYGTLIKRVKNGEEILKKKYLIKVKINGVIKSFRELSDESNISYDTILRRYNTGWDLEDLLKPITKETMHIKIKDEIHTVSEWAKISGLTSNIISSRIQYGWENEDLLKPMQKTGRPKKFIEINGESHTLDEWCEIADISPMTFYKRYKKGLKGNELIKSTNKRRDSAVK